MFSNALSFTRRCSRFLALAGLLALAVPVGFSMGLDGPAQAQSRGGGGGGGGGGSGGSGGNHANRVLECLGGLCKVVTECDGRECGGTPPCIANCGNPPCVGPSCDSSTNDGPKVTYAITPAGCEVKTCENDGRNQTCLTKLARDPAMCTKKRS